MFKIARLIWILVLCLAKGVEGSTIQTSYQFTGSASNVVIAGGFLTADGLAYGSLGNIAGVVFETGNDVNLTTFQNYGTFTMRFPDGSTASGDLYENDVNVSLATFTGPFTQELTFTTGTGMFVDVSGVLTGGGNIYPTYYTTSGGGTLTAPDLVMAPEPASFLLLAIGTAFMLVRLAKRA